MGNIVLTKFRCLKIFKTKAYPRKGIEHVQKGPMQSPKLHGVSMSALEYLWTLLCPWHFWVTIYYMTIYGPYPSIPCQLRLASCTFCRAAAAALAKIVLGAWAKPGTVLSAHRTTLSANIGTKKLLRISWNACHKPNDVMLRGSMPSNLA